MALFYDQVPRLTLFYYIRLVIYEDDACPSYKVPWSATPSGWDNIHDDFVEECSEKGEEAASIVELVETQFPVLGSVPLKWIQHKMQQD